MERVLDGERLERLLEAGRGLLADMDLGLVLDRLLDLARELTGAQYAALGILDERRNELAQFLTVGIDQETHQAIGDLPRGRGILGILIEEAKPLRLHDLGAHPRSYGFPPAHPEMRSFLGVPILIRGEAWGNVYLTEKAGGEDFDEADEASVVVLADWAALAIEHARLYEAVSARRIELERAVRGFEATAAIARAVGGETDLDRVLELIVKRARALVEARSVLILLHEGDKLRLAAGAGQVADHDVERALAVRPEDLGVADATAALQVPLVFRGRALGLLIAFDRLSGPDSFNRDDEQLLQAFAASAATAVANAQAVEAERLRHSLRAAEEERRRWARELHDETLQGLAGLRVLLRGAARQSDPLKVQAAIAEAADHVTREIDSLRAIITDLRPAALDDLGLGPALDSLLQRTAAAQGLDVRSSVDLPDRRLAPELETVVYRVVQEALTNVGKHAQASTVAVALHVADDRLGIRVADDGVGIAPDTPAGGFGLIGMRERVALAGGELEVTPGEPGTVVRATLPLTYAEYGNVTPP